MEFYKNHATIFERIITRFLYQYDIDVRRDAVYRSLAWSSIAVEGYSVNRSPPMADLQWAFRQTRFFVRKPNLLREQR